MRTFYGKVFSGGNLPTAAFGYICLGTNSTIADGTTTLSQQLMFEGEVDEVVNLLKKQLDKAGRDVKRQLRKLNGE